MDIVEWLRNAASEHNMYRCEEAADEIERLRDSLERIACFCQEQCKMNCAGWIASFALKEKE
jgi:hypothetical protein